MLECWRSYITCILCPPVPIDIHTWSALDPYSIASYVVMLNIVFYVYFMTASADRHLYTQCSRIHLESPRMLECWILYFTCILSSPVPINMHTRSAGITKPSVFHLHHISSYCLTLSLPKKPAQKAFLLVEGHCKNVNPHVIEHKAVVPDTA